MQILHKVALAFAADGYHQTSVNSLAERIGVSKPVLYYYAKNKDDLLFQCMMVTHVELMEVIESARRTKMSAVGRIASFFVSYTEVMCGDFGRCVALVDHKALSPDTGAKVVTMLRKIERAVADMISEGHTDGSVAPCDPLLAARALFGAFNGIPRWFNNEGSLRPREVAEAYLDIVLRGLQRS
ncbi:TetR/AcrR family transcriptional regulator [Sphingobium subterraneum]|uniref:AcrR family transcriptional regulator n=1 Tax=Sphingobium subterraneum TaxID=627688 RepID=A0A841JB08_9SPHN|nr:TetR/AcrR family transcriptional regulator [Sphingobium subterraneum]MBB6125311.1 AcrR family transcriptional regulator [Sphingobium subterraneum]